MHGHLCHIYIYVPIDHLYSLVISAGNGALLVKADIKLIKGVYRMLSIHSENQTLLGVCWEGTSSYTDRALPFNIIAAVVEALQWIVVNKGVRNLLYYLDVFIFVSESLEEASINKQILVDIFSHLGVSLLYE